MIKVATEKNQAIKSILKIRRWCFSPTAAEGLEP